MTPPRFFLFILPAILFTLPALAQGTGNESRVASDFRREGVSLKSCERFNLQNITNCAETLVTAQPIHIAVGSLAPQNGIGAGLAFIEHKDFTDEWRLNWNVDAVASSNLSWRAGGYMKGYILPKMRLVPVYTAPRSGPPRKTAVAPSRPTLLGYPTAPVFNLYSETDSLNLLYFFGIGPHTSLARQSAFGFQETVVGGSAVVPLSGKFGASVLGEVNGRFPTVRPNKQSGVPSIETLYTEVDAPGLSHQAGFLQTGEGLRFRPRLFSDSLRLNYLLQFQQFTAPTDSTYSFRRWSADLDHELPLYRNVQIAHTNDRNGPDSCAADPPGSKCPPVSLSRNLEGSFDVRLLMTGSVANAGSVVPFYFQPTLGGSDVNGRMLLSSYQDYRFRAPNLLLLRGTFEHSLWKLPLGFLFSVDEGKVGLRRDDISFDHLRHSFSTGITLHAGGLPVMNLAFAWGGGEGTHTIATVSPILLGGSSRPSLF